MTNEELNQYYQNLLIIQYKSKEKAQETINLLVDSQNIFELIQDVKNGYNIETAVGKQLDVLAKYVGCKRVVTGVNFDRVYFGYILYSDDPTLRTTIHGYDDYNGLTTDAQFEKYEASGESLFSLTDEELRFNIKLKIIKNNSNASLQVIDDLTFEFFGNSILLFDRLNMSMSIIVDASVQRLITIAASEELIPKPAGVSLVLTYAKNINNMFYLIKYDQIPKSYMTGFVEYGSTTLGGFVTYGTIF